MRPPSGDQLGIVYEMIIIGDVSEFGGIIEEILVGNHVDGLGPARQNIRIGRDPVVLILGLEF